MSDPIAFRKRLHSEPITTPIRSEGFNINICLGPFIVGSPEPDWASVAAQLVAECRREWHVAHGRVTYPVTPRV